MSDSNRLAGFKVRPKSTGPAEVCKADEVGEACGFVDLALRKKSGRRSSPRKCQRHPKVSPRAGEGIEAEADRLVSLKVR
jgi:hypothetical protein